ncbi:Hypothetical protein KLENKIAIHU_2124, partial [Klenkia terrae]
VLSTTTYTGEIQGHTVEVRFDQKLVVVNRVDLAVDGTQVDAAKVVYGERELTTTLDDGTVVAVVVHSGMNGEATRVQLPQADGSFTDLQAR